MGINVLSTKLALKLKGRSQIFKAVILLYILTFLIGGVLNWITYGREMNVEKLLVAGLIIFILIRGAIIIYSFYKRNISKVCEVTISLNNKQLNLKGLVDTGNSLVEPISKKPVNIVPLGKIEDLLTSKQVDYIKSFLECETVSRDVDLEDLKGICYIPYNSVGKKNGLIPAIKADKMKIYQDQRVSEIFMPIIGICQNEFVSDKRYHIILNPKLVD